MPTRRSLLLLLAVVALCAPLVACGSETAAPEPRPAGSADPAALPTTIPVPDGEVTTRGPVTVLDDGNGPQLCLGGVMESYPPQCGGLALVGWDWADHDGDYEQGMGTRWGEFVVTGAFDGDTFTVREAVPAAEYDAPPSSDDDFETSCPEPDGGWVVDPDRVSETDYEAAMQTAGRLDDYAGSFVDTSRDPRTPQQVDQDFTEGNDDASWWIVNVAVTGDPAAAEAAIREVWGGGICVTGAEVTYRELRRIQDAVTDAEVPGFLGSGSDGDAVELGVVHDDGSIQAWADDEFGEDRVVVRSALVEPGPG